MSDKEEDIKTTNPFLINEMERVHENELTILSGKVTPVIKKAYCPKCGKEIISEFPVIFNPYTKDKYCVYHCECGWEASLDYAYPRIVFMDDAGNEIEAFTK